MSLLSEFLALTQGWRTVFPQQRTFQRAVCQTLDSPGVPGTPPRIIWTKGGQNRSWSGIFLALALPVGAARVVSAESEAGPGLLPATAGRSGSRRYPVAQDRTMYSPCIRQAFYQRDPLSPPFRVNLMLGVRFVQAALLTPLHHTTAVGARALPIGFQEVSRVKRPASSDP